MTFVYVEIYFTLRNIFYYIEPLFLFPLFEKNSTKNFFFGKMLIFPKIRKILKFKYILPSGVDTRNFFSCTYCNNVFSETQGERYEYHPLQAQQQADVVQLWLPGNPCL